MQTKQRCKVLTYYRRLSFYISLAKAFRVTWSKRKCELTDRDWENAVQGLGKVQAFFRDTAHARCLNMPRFYNWIHTLTKQLAVIVSLPHTLDTRIALERNLFSST